MKLPKNLHRLFNTWADVRWLLTTHLNGMDVPQFYSFELTGNEDSPLEITLYAWQDPHVGDKPVARYELLPHGSYRRAE